MSRKARAKSPEFQKQLANLRKGRSYREFARLLEAKTGIGFSYATLKKVENGDLAPNPSLIYALEAFGGFSSGEMLRAYVSGAHGASPQKRDLLRHAGTQGSAIPKGEPDDSAQARIQQLEDRVAAYKTLIGKIRTLGAEFLELTNDREEGRKAPRAQAGRRIRG